MRRTFNTQDEIERSSTAPAYASAQASQIFGPDSDAVLAQNMFRKNPVRYRELRREWQYQLGELKRPESHYDRD